MGTAAPAENEHYELQGLLNEHDQLDSPRTDPEKATRFHKVESSGLGIQLVFIGLFRATQPLFFMVVAPFINSMLVNELHTADEVHVGHYSGVVESMASVGMAVGTTIVAHYSDIYGRKRITLFGVLLSCFFSGAFGFVRVYWLLVVVRLCMGLAISAQAATTKVMVSELSSMDNIAQNMVYTGMGWQLGATFAPAVGGILAVPARTWPALFQDTLFDTYPYALPTLLTAIFPACAAIAGFYVLRETHPGLRTSRHRRQSFRETLRGDIVQALSAESVIIRFKNLAREKLYPKNGLPPLFSCGEGFILVFWASQIFQIVSLQVAELLFFFSSPAIGGLGLTQGQMSVYLTLRPLMICLFEATTFDRLSKRFGVEAYMRKLIWLPPVLFIIYLAMAHATINGTHSPALTVAGLGASLALQVVSNSLFLCGDVLIPARSPTAEQLSTINAVSEIIAQIAVGVGASVGSSLFADSAALTDSFWHGKMVWIVLFALSCLVAGLTQKITHIDGWREKTQSEKMHTQE